MTVSAHNAALNFLVRQWLLLVSAAGLVLTSVYLGRLPVPALREMEVLFILFVLFVAVKGLENSGLVSRLSQGVGRGRFVAVRLVLATFILSMLVTNDVALIVLVPLTLVLRLDRKGTIVILEALAANAGSALTPFGNPQNLFIYWYYRVHPIEFVTAIAPFSLVFLVILVVASLFLETGIEPAVPRGEPGVKPGAYVYGVLLLVAVLAVLRVLPVWSGVLVGAYALVFDRRSLRVDYALLVTFFCFFGLAGNLETVLASRLEHPGHVFLFSALSS